MTPFLRKLLGMNWVLVLLMYGLLVFGVFMIESAARHVSVPDEVLRQYGSAGVYHAAMQKKWIIVGSLAFFVAAFIDYRWIRWLGLPLYASSMLLLYLAILQDDPVHRLDLPGLPAFQPSQLGICAGILMVSWLVQDLPKLHRWFGLPFARIAIIGGFSALPFGLVLAMGDTGSALVWIPVLVIALFVGGMPFRYLSFIGWIGAGLLPLAYFIALPLMSPRGMVRIETWLRMLRGQEVDISAEGYGAHYVTMAVGKAGWKGTGWNASAEQGSIHAKGFIPNDTAHNDYIFAVIAEELGFRGGLLLLAGFALLLIQGLFIAFYSRDLTGRMIASLVVALFFAHVFESIGMCVLLLPITGIPLPLVSYSGTFVVVCMFLLGLVQSVWIHRNVKPRLKTPDEAAT